MFIIILCLKDEPIEPNGKYTFNPKTKLNLLIFTFLLNENLY